MLKLAFSFQQLAHKTERTPGFESLKLLSSKTMEIPKTLLAGGDSRAFFMAKVVSFHGYFHYFILHQFQLLNFNSRSYMYQILEPTKENAREYIQEILRKRNLHLLHLLRLFSLV